MHAFRYRNPPLGFVSSKLSSSLVYKLPEASVRISIIVMFVSMYFQIKSRVWFCFLFLLLRTSTTSQFSGSGFSDGCDNSSTYLLLPCSDIDSSATTSMQYSVMDITSTAILTSTLLVGTSTITSSALSIVSSTQEPSQLVRSTSVSRFLSLNVSSTSITETSSILNFNISMSAGSISLTSTTIRSSSLTPTVRQSPSLTPMVSESSPLVPTESLSFSLVVTDSSSEHTFPISSLSFSSNQTMIQPSVSSLVDSTLILSTSSDSKIPSTSSQPLTVPSLTPSVAITMEPQNIAPIAASAASIVAVVLIICLIIVVCLIVFVQKRKKKKRTLLPTDDIDGTAKGNEHKLFTLSDENTPKDIIGLPEESITLGTFGKEPQVVEVDLGTSIGVLKFPELPATDNGESLPPLIIYNPVKFDETIMSNTLPSRGKQMSMNRSAQESDAVVSQLTAGELKPSKSFSGINKLENLSISLSPPDITNENSTQETSTPMSPLYQTPRVLNTLENQNRDVVQSTNTTSGEYVTIVPHSKVMPNDKSFSIVGDPFSPNQTTSTLEPKVPVTSHNEEPKESIYDNARLLRAKIQKLGSPEKKLTPDKSETSSGIYDVPKSMVLPRTTKSEVIKTKAHTENLLEQAKPIAHNNSSGIYDIPRKLLAKEVKVSESPLTQDLSLSVVVPEARQEDKETHSYHKDTAITDITKPALHPKRITALEKLAPYENVSFPEGPNQVSPVNPDNGHDHKITPPRRSNDPSLPTITSRASAPYENVSHSFPQNSHYADSTNPNRDRIYDIPPPKCSNEVEVDDLLVMTQKPIVTSSASLDSDHNYEIPPPNWSNEVHDLEDMTQNLEVSSSASAGSDYKMLPSSSIGNNEVADLNVSTKEPDITLSLECVEAKPLPKPRLKLKQHRLPIIPKNVLQELRAKQNTSIEVSGSVTAGIEELPSNINSPAVKVKPPPVMPKLPPAVMAKPHVGKVEPPTVKVKPPVIKPKPRHMS